LIIYAHWYLRQRAEDLVKKFGFRNPPVDLYNVACSLGIEIIELSLPTWFFGALLNIKGDYYIILNKLMPQSRKNFTIAHEIAHYQLHGGEICSMKNSKRDYFHREADIFAAELCMPSFMVIREAHNWGNDYKFLAHLFGVSEIAMLRKLQELRLIPAENYAWSCVKK